MVAEHKPAPMEGQLRRTPADDCVHCGFCLPACPTWHNWQEEMDSPRGRIDLFRALDDGRITVSKTVAAHFDRCLGCFGCVTACPSGVRYDHIIEAARVRIERDYQRPLVDRLFRSMIFALFPWPKRLRATALFLWLYQVSGLQWLVRKLGILKFSQKLSQLESLAPPLSREAVFTRIPERTPAQGEVRARAGVLTGCVQRVFFPGVNVSTLRVLSAEGVEVLAPKGQGCCGALSMHAGRIEESKRLTRELIEEFERANVEVVVVNAAGCGSHLKDVAHVFEDDPEMAERARAFAAKVRDVNEFLHALGPRAPRGPIKERVAYHSACHLGHGQQITEAPRALLRAIPGLELVEVPEPDQCCGSAGIYNLVQATSSLQVGQRKADAVISTGAGILASANPGCTLHVGKLLAERGVHIETAHPIELLDRSITSKAH